MGDVISGVTDALGLTNNSGDAALAAQTNAANQANATQMKMFEQNRQDMQPWRQAGASALNQLQSKLPELSRSFTMQDFMSGDPGYQFRMDQGQQALEKSAAARGGLMNGGTMKALARYGQDYASNEYQNAYNRFNNDRNTTYNMLSGLAGTGQAAASQIGQAGMQTGANIAQNQIGLGNAAAANATAQTNRLGNLFGQAASGAGMAAGAALFSDERLKEDITPVSQEDLNELREKVKAYKFKYKDKKHGSGEFVGVMAQELEQTRLGKNLVSYNQEGLRYIDTQKLMSLLLASLVGA